MEFNIQIFNESELRNYNRYRQVALSYKPKNIRNVFLTSKISEIIYISLYILLNNLFLHIFTQK